jgi:hypothetical protein
MLSDIRTISDLRKYKHFQRGDMMLGEGIIKDIAYIDDPVEGKAVIFFFENGNVGSIENLTIKKQNETNI